jgi:hypothetical protein
MVSGVNAVTEQGELVFLDASYPPPGCPCFFFDLARVILVAGVNKIVPLWSTPRRAYALL